MVSVRVAELGLQIGPESVNVKDKLIVGLGDSYASGEGNPDIRQIRQRFNRYRQSVVFLDRLAAPQKNAPFIDSAQCSTGAVIAQLILINSKQHCRWRFPTRIRRYICFLLLRGAVTARSQIKYKQK